MKYLKYVILLLLCIAPSIAHADVAGTIQTGTLTDQKICTWDGALTSLVCNKTLADADIPNDITIDLATTATTANAGDSATSFFSTGTIEDARLSTTVSLLGQTISFITPAEIVDECTGSQSVRRNSGDTAWECYTPASTPVSAANGGTGIDTSASTGWAKVASGTWSVGGIPGACELILEAPVSADELEFCEKPTALTATAVRCECYGTCTTVPTLKICKGEDLGDDTCTTNLLDATETTTLSCSTAGGSDVALNSTALTANQGATLIIANSPTADVDRVRVVFEYTTP